MIFLDTGAFIARYVARDQYHRRAVECWSSLERSRDRLFTSNAVLNETFTLLGRFDGYAFAAERASNIYASTSLTILRPTHDDEVSAIAFFRKFAAQRVSFTDCLSFVLIRKQKIARAFTFDRHFALAGFSIVPKETAHGK
ncbi:MAG: twitching motility protein PilT [Planctomycetes bacterium RBG_16_59_8]|nr:MAG: twitching motility protein PilT [Planctomycetes bacterium RBG_16_59_8]